MTNSPKGEPAQSHKTLIPARTCNEQSTDASFSSDRLHGNCDGWTKLPSNQGRT